jgi:hypothetical protein
VKIPLVAGAAAVTFLHRHGSAGGRESSRDQAIADGSGAAAGKSSDPLIHSPRQLVP